MYLFAVCVLTIGIVLFSFSYWVGKRKRVIDQFESDIRIFLALILLLSFYVQFLILSVIYFASILLSVDLNYVVTFIYFLFPLLLGFSLYMLLPWFYRRALRLENIPVPENVQKICSIIGLDEIPQVCTTFLKIPPLVYGRRKKKSVLVLPGNMDSLLTEEEQYAVITHELSHIKQGDVGFFTWLILLIEGFKYWLLPLPLVMYLGMTSYFIRSDSNPVPFFLVILFFVSLVLLKNSLSRTRESLADAYTVFHGLETPLKNALIKYAALKTVQKGYVSALCFYHAQYKSVLSTHPPLKERLKNIDKKTYLVEPLTNLSRELAFWTGLVSAFLFYNASYSIISFSLFLNLFFPVSIESLSSVVVMVDFILVISVIGISYVFPSTKGLILFSDLKNPSFTLPFIRNWGITIATAVCILYGLTLSIDALQIYIPAAIIGFFVWLEGFAASRYHEPIKKNWYLIFSPVFILTLLFYPVKLVYHSFSGLNIDLSYSIVSMVIIIAVALLIFLVLAETGYIILDEEGQFMGLFGKKIELRSSAAFGLTEVVLLFLVPSLLSFGVYTVSCFLDSLGILPEMSLFLVIIPVLVFYSFSKSDILFFKEVLFYIDILEGNISEENIEFIQNVIKEYQNPDGGFD